ncbi:MAG: aminoglycoside phosphotransferase family protein [Clostridiales bacterium]|jgi:hypothetical protein|nr:aminoglycoside phosphotransferase family protein [Clostridiales bacterium]
MMIYVEEVKKFKIYGEPVVIAPYGEGHINETFYVETDKKAKYILQKINSGLFTDVGRLMNNIFLVTEHAGEKIRRAGGDVARETLTIVRTGDDGLYLKSDGGYFRMYIFIDNATAHQTVTDPRQFYESAAAFGAFQNYLADFDADRLYETIPSFHDTVKRYRDFTKSVSENRSGRLKNAEREVEFVVKRQKYCPRIVDLLSSGAMPLRVTHNDTKLNNVMLDDKTGKAVAVIDLDTVMPGSACYDFGDSIRFGTNSGAEDEPDLDKVNFRIDLFEVYAEGYLGALKSITKCEKDMLAFSGILMTYECGMRFLSDYLDGDIYFRTRRESHNLDRCRTQFKLIEDMEKRLPETERIIGRI